MSGYIQVAGVPVTLRGAVSGVRLSPNAQVRTAPFVGSDLSATPGCSAFGTLQRLIRVNELPPVALMSLFGIRTRRADDLSAQMTFSEARQVALAKALELPEVPPEWNPSTWFPFKAPSNVLATGWTFRSCASCLRQGYHTLLHQLPWIHVCPWHDEPLLAQCAACGHPPASAADWTVGRNLACKCGHMPLDTDAALYALEAPSGAAEFIRDYRDWASQARAESQLVLPERAGDPREALATLVQLPAALRALTGQRAGAQATRGARHGDRTVHTHARTLVRANAAPTADRDGLVRLEDLRRDRPGFLTTPARLAPALSAVAADVALRLPVKSLTDLELTLFLAGTCIEAPEGFDPAPRAFSGEVSMLPPTRIGERQFLNLMCVHPVTYRVVTALVDAALDGRTLFDFHAQASTTEFDLLMRACGQVLGRGYAEGLRSTLATHIPDIRRGLRQAPRLTVPWALVSRRSGRLDVIRLVWTSLSCAPFGEAALLAAEDEANRRRQRARRSKRSAAK